MKSKQQLEGSIKHDFHYMFAPPTVRSASDILLHPRTLRHTFTAQICLTDAGRFVFCSSSLRKDFISFAAHDCLTGCRATWGESWSEPRDGNDSKHGNNIRSACEINIFYV